MNSPVKHRRTLPVHFLENVSWSVNRHFYDAATRALTVSVSSITEMVNREWEGSNVIIQEDDVKRALLELQAMDKLRFTWKSNDVILTYNCPFLGVDSETWHRTFDGLFGLYSNPPSLYYLQNELSHISNSPRRTTLDQLGRKYRGSTNTALTILRALQMMRVLYFTDDGTHISITDVRRDRCNKAFYDETFYVTRSAIS